MERGEAVDPERYYFRINPLFETAATTYDWLNRILAVGIGTSTARWARLQRVRGAIDKASVAPRTSKHGVMTADSHLRKQQQLTNPIARLLLMPAESMNIAQAPENGDFHGRRDTGRNPRRRGRETGSGAPESLAAPRPIQSVPGKMNLPE